MAEQVVTVDAKPPAGSGTGTVFSILLAISLCHALNDMMQSLLPAIYPNLRADFGLSFTQVGMLTFTYQVTASILQPLIGYSADKRPMPLALPGGTVFSLLGLMTLSVAHAYPVLLLGSSLLGMGSSVFHPESSRVARMASGGKYGLAQSLFQVGGNVGSALGPLAAALVVVRWGQSSLAFFALLALLSGSVLWWVASWYKHHGLTRLKQAARANTAAHLLPKGRTIFSVGILMLLIFSKFFYLASLSSYYTFYLIERFGLSVADAQVHLFAFLVAVAIGTIVGGPLGDRFGRKYVIWFSIAGILPFTLLLPHVSLFWTGPLTVIIGLIMASAFPAIVVFAQELVPSRIGMISGLAFGFSFGMAGLGAAFMGWLADKTSIATVYEIAGFLPVIGFVTVLLPNIERRKP